MVEIQRTEALVTRVAPRMIRVVLSDEACNLDLAQLRGIANAAGTLLTVDLAHLAGSVAARKHASPVSFVDFAVAATHGNLRGPFGALVLANGRYALTLDRVASAFCERVPPLGTIAAKAVALKEALCEDFVRYQTGMIENAAAMRKTLLARGLAVAPRQVASPIVVMDLAPLSLGAQQAVKMLNAAHINVEPYRSQSLVGKSIAANRLGLSTAAISARGFRPAQAEAVAHLVADVIVAQGGTDAIRHARRRAVELSSRFLAQSIDAPYQRHSL
jgi:glycine hydroxymethyltransferase